MTVYHERHKKTTCKILILYVTEQIRKNVWKIRMDRRYYKSREAIFNAFVSLLSEKELSKITVNEIIERADVSRATFYSHFETKNYLLRELCEELFCHLFDALEQPMNKHRHIFSCDAPDSVFLHLLQHIQKNDQHIRTLLSCPNNELFLRYFKTDLQQLIRAQLPIFASEKTKELPEDLLVRHIAAAFTESVRYWTDNGMEASAETIASYFFMLV